MNSHLVISDTFWLAGNFAYVRAFMYERKHLELTFKKWLFFIHYASHVPADINVYYGFSISYL